MLQTKSVNKICEIIAMTMMLKRDYENPLQNFMLGLVDMLEAESAESQSLERGKGSNFPQTIYETTSTPGSDSIGISTSPAHHYSQPAASSHPGTPDKKRPISQTSFEAQSTETTPNKLAQPEAKVQALQDSFARTIINQLWFGQIGIPWARGRKMFLTYTEFFPL